MTYRPISMSMMWKLNKKEIKEIENKYVRMNRIEIYKNN